MLSTSCDEKLNGKFERKKRTAKVDVRLLVLLCATSGQQLQSMFVLARTHLLGMFVRSYNGFGSLVGFFFFGDFIVSGQSIDRKTNRAIKIERKNRTAKVEQAVFCLVGI